MKKMETFTNLVKEYAMRVDRNKMMSSEKYMAIELDSGVRKAVNNPKRMAKLRK
jgi:hypothetical protein